LTRKKELLKERENGESRAITGGLPNPRKEELKRQS